jgi:hypothetical protein
MSPDSYRDHGDDSTYRPRFDSSVPIPLRVALTVGDDTIVL